MAARLDTAAVKAAYRRYARVYDLLFGAIFQPGRRRVIRSLACRPGERVLEVGVGTGLSLPLYPRHSRVVGIDLSRDMLERARERVRRRGLEQVEALLEMDAERMAFAAGAFDKVVAMYVVSVVPHPERLVAEMCRVCKPGGDIFIVNHFSSSHPLLRASEGMFSRFAGKMGFRPDLPLEPLLEGTGLQLVEAGRTNLFGYWRMLRCRNGCRSELAA